MGAKNYKTIVVGWLCLLQACVKDKPNPANNTAATGNGSTFIVCEGNFGAGDATLFASNAAADSVFGDLYEAANGQPMGDVFQSMTRIGDRYFLCVNSSDKVIAINTTTHKAEGVINIPKPRYVLAVGASKAYVTTLYSNKVYIINTQTLQQTGTIELPALNTEGMCLYNASVFITAWDTANNKVYRIDPTTDKLIQTITTSGYAPQAALVDREQMLWILSGNQTKGKTAAWTRIDPSTGIALATYTFPATADVLKPQMNLTKDTLYFIAVNYKGGTDNNGIYRMGIHAAALPAQPFIAAQRYQYFWGLGINPANSNIYVGDPRGFTQKGLVTIYRPDGTLLHTFAVGRGPGMFCFN
jgi:YVTN family beta-propeller protein